jgi:hypothetical protein
MRELGRHVGRDLLLVHAPKPTASVERELV